ncbi:assembly factor cbp4 [Terfezia boudieri ATCC MYA-4762]|uniref:Cytochrome b mRNA-processing protein 4 n=1 Tax=Terfezia boudieri ATCC MYA-4762 TaxID=1051890 RepID=A0A3N4LX74_9PEZI|nr:assembly factor cbp4 [Terfezia boudieri ATCC MYA-4762]
MKQKTVTGLKMAVGGLAVLIGGPALTWYVMPSEEELFKRYNPDLQRRALSERPARLQAHADFMHKLSEYSKSDKPIWTVAAEEQAREKAEIEAGRKRAMEEKESMRMDLLEEQRRLGGRA